MTQITELKANLNKVCDVLDELGVMYTIVGGFARDLALGLEPKDVDIVVYKLPTVGTISYGSGCERPAYLTDYDVKEVLKCKLGIKVSPWLTIYNKEAQDRLDGLYKLQSINIDLLFYKNCDTEWDVIDHFDFNINQFGYSRESDKAYYYGASPLVPLKMIRDIENQERINYITAKYADNLDKIKELHEELLNG